MSSQKAHSLLSDLYRILATYQTADFTEASRLSPEMAHIVDAIKSHTEIRNRSLTSNKNENRLRSSFAIQSTSTPSQKINSATEILLALKRSAFYATVKDLELLAQKYGIKLKPKPKEGRDRYARRLAQTFVNLPMEVREAVLNEVAENATSQTAGWVNLLRGR